MNQGYRLRQFEAIEKENIKIAKSIFYQESKLTGRAKMESDFQKHRMMSNNLAKIKRKNLGTSNQSVHSSRTKLNKSQSGLTLPPINQKKSQARLSNIYEKSPTEREKSATNETPRPGTNAEEDPKSAEKLPYIAKKKRFKKRH